MTVIARKEIKRTRRGRECGSCGGWILDGTAAVRLYGYAGAGDPKFALYLHPLCEYRVCCLREQR